MTQTATDTPTSDPRPPGWLAEGIRATLARLNHVSDTGWVATLLAGTASYAVIAYAASGWQLSRLCTGAAFAAIMLTAALLTLASVRTLRPGPGVRAPYGQRYVRFHAVIDGLDNDLKSLRTRRRRDHTAEAALSDLRARAWRLDHPGVRAQQQAIIDEYATRTAGERRTAPPTTLFGRDRGTPAPVPVDVLAPPRPDGRYITAAVLRRARHVALARTETTARHLAMTATVIVAVCIPVCLRSADYGWLWPDRGNRPVPDSLNTGLGWVLWSAIVLTAFAAILIIALAIGYAASPHTAPRRAAFSAPITPLIVAEIVCAAVALVSMTLFTQAFSST